jgi:hypothetical protein
LPPKADSLEEFDFLEGTPCWVGPDVFYQCIRHIVHFLELLKLDILTLASILLDEVAAEAECFLVI